MLNSMNYIHNTVYLVFFARIVLYLEPNPSLVGFCCRTFRLEEICNFPRLDQQLNAGGMPTHVYCHVVACLLVRGGFEMGAVHEL